MTYNPPEAATTSSTADISDQTLREALIASAQSYHASELDDHRNAEAREAGTAEADINPWPTWGDTGHQEWHQGYYAHGRWHEPRQPEPTPIRTQGGRKRQDDTWN